MLNVLVRHTAKRHTSTRQVSVMDFAPFNNSILVSLRLSDSEFFRQLLNVAKCVAFDAIVFVVGVFKQLLTRVV